MYQRRISTRAVCAALDYGRVYRTRGAVIYALTRKTAKQCRKDGRCGTKLDGLQVVSAADGSILTAYRNKRRRPAKRWLVR